MTGLTAADRKENREAWVRTIENARSHPRGIQAYCKQNSIQPKMYYRWFGKLRSEHPEWKALTKEGKEYGQRKPNQGKREFWKEKVRLWKMSGLSQVEFCRREKLGAASLSAWNRALEKERPQKEVAKCERSIGDKFVKVSLSDDLSASALVQDERKRPDQVFLATAGVAAEIVDERGCVRIYNGATAETITAVLNARRLVS